MSIDEMITKLADEQSGKLVDVLKMLTESKKLGNMVLNSLGPLVLLMTPKSIAGIQLAIAVCYMTGYEQARIDSMNELFSTKAD